MAHRPTSLHFNFGAGHIKDWYPDRFQKKNAYLQNEPLLRAVPRISQVVNYEFYLPRCRKSVLTWPSPTDTFHTTHSFPSLFFGRKNPALMCLIFAPHEIVPFVAFHRQRSDSASNAHSLAAEPFTIIFPWEIETANLLQIAAKEDGEETTRSLG